MTPKQRRKKKSLVGYIDKEWLQIFGHWIGERRTCDSANYIRREGNLLPFCSYKKKERGMKKVRITIEEI